MTPDQQPPLPSLGQGAVAYAPVADVVTVPKCRASTVVAPEVYCGAPATVPVVVACVHEHVKASAACPDCAPELGDHYCADCFRADGHKCRLVVLAGGAS